MKNLRLRLVLLSMGALLTLGLSQRVAQAVGCPDISAGGTVYGDYDCRLITACGGSCYFSCSCSNLFPGSSCDDVLHEAGFQDVDPGDPCIN